jgi:4-hydroxybenzoate polyprenyltransferase
MEGREGEDMESDRLAIGGRIRSFFGLSRMTHSVLDIAHPAVGAVMVLGGLPGPTTVVVGLLAAFAGFTAVFALNDVMDCRVDCEKMSKYRKSGECFDIDSVGLRHPIAQGTLTFTSALVWVLFWGIGSLVLAYILNPVCSALMIVAAGLEVGYCRLLRVSHWKAVLSGLMVAVGGLAGVYAVSAQPAPRMVVLFILWAFAWEVGCRNIPNDWSDLEEDVHLGIRTIPVRYGRRVAAWISFSLLCVTVASSVLFPLIVPLRHPVLYLAGAAAAGGALLVAPAARWLRRGNTEAAMFFFNRACFYPLAVFTVTALLAVV